jgi:8-oxo-dGTP diphosphatase/2-hydroxy-dATP diphosphatase
MKKKILTLCIVHQHPKILLGMKKRGFGAGRWNGFGGKLIPGETIEQAAKREMKEEASVDIIDFQKVGILDFEFKGNPEILEVNIFRVNEFMGEPTESEEMKPQWYFIDEIPFKEMWPDDIHWFPLFLKGKKFKGKFLFGEGDSILEHELTEVGEI